MDTKRYIPYISYQFKCNICKMECLNSNRIVPLTRIPNKCEGATNLDTGYNRLFTRYEKRVHDVKQLTKQTNNRKMGCLNSYQIVPLMIIPNKCEASLKLVLTGICWDNSWKSMIGNFVIQNSSQIQNLKKIK